MDQPRASNFAFYLFILYLASFFLRLPARLPVLGLIRMDMLIVLALFALTMGIKLTDRSGVSKWLGALIICAVVSLPFSTWPGSVLSKGLPSLVKAVIFFYFTYKIVDTEARLKIVVGAFLLFNTFRVLEPLYMNIAYGYWGSKTSFGWEAVQRLAGSPYDVINSNGLAFVIASILPFYHYLLGSTGWKGKAVYLALLVPFMYTMSLTLSRSGLVAIAMIYGVVFLQSRYKFGLAAAGVLGIAVFFASLNEVQRDRYLSIVDDDAKSAETAQGRFSGWQTDIGVAMHAPIFGHGVGTSGEANWNFAGSGTKSHNLWLEVLQELGVVGFVIFVGYVISILKEFAATKINMASSANTNSEFLKNCLKAMNTWMYMNLLFSLASYGLTSYEWYLFGAFSVILTRLSNKNRASQTVKA